MNSAAKRDWLALGCALAAVAIWAWWMSATRVAAQEGIAPLDVALMRYAIPALLLIPVWLRTWHKLKLAPLWSIVAMLGWGAPFLWLVTASLKESSVVYFATIVPCTMPLFAVIAEIVFFKQRLTKSQVIGYTTISVAATLVILNAFLGGGASLLSIGLMFLAAAGWACYVVAFRHTGLSAAEAAAWVCTVSTIVIMIIKLALGGALLPLTKEQLIFNAFAQGFLSGFVAVIVYTVAIGRLGPARAASFSILIPMLASFFAWIWLGEVPTGFNLVALLLGTIGVAIINGMFTLQKVK